MFASSSHASAPGLGGDAVGGGLAGLASGSSAAPSNDFQNKKLFIGGLSYETTDQSLGEYFGQFGEVASASVLRDASTSRSRGFGFVTFVKSTSAREALEHHHHVVDGRVVESKFAVPRRKIEMEEFQAAAAAQAQQQQLQQHPPAQQQAHQGGAPAARTHSPVDAFGGHQQVVAQPPSGVAPLPRTSSLSQTSLPQTSPTHPSMPTSPNAVHSVSSSPYPHVGAGRSMMTPSPPNVSGPQHHMQQSSPDGDIIANKIFVGGLRYTTGHESLRQHFSRFGEVETAQVIFNRDTKKSRGFGFVVFRDPESVERVLVAQRQGPPVVEGKSVEVKTCVARQDGTMGVMSMNKPAPYSSPPSNAPMAAQQHQRLSSGSPPPSMSMGFRASPNAPPPLQPVAPAPQSSPIAVGGGHSSFYPPPAQQHQHFAYSGHSSPPPTSSPPTILHSSPVGVGPHVGLSSSLRGLGSQQQQQQQHYTGMMSSPNATPMRMAPPSVSQQSTPNGTPLRPLVSSGNSGSGFSSMSSSSIPSGRLGGLAPHPVTSSISSAVDLWGLTSPVLFDHEDRQLRTAAMEGNPSAIPSLMPPMGGGPTGGHLSPRSTSPYALMSAFAPLPLEASFGAMSSPQGGSGNKLGRSSSMSTSSASTLTSVTNRDSQLPPKLDPIPQQQPHSRTAFAPMASTFVPRGNGLGGAAFAPSGLPPALVNSTAPTAADDDVDFISITASLASLASTTPPQMSPATTAIGTGNTGRRGSGGFVATTGSSAQGGGGIW